MLRDITVVILAILWLALIVVLSLSSSVASHGRLWQEILNIGHVAAYGLLALLLLRAFQRKRAQRVPSVRAYFLVFVVSSAFGILMELLQYYGARDADPVDLLRNAAGIIAALLIYSIFPRQRAVWRGRLRQFASLLAVTVSIGVVWAAVYPGVFAIIGLIHRLSSLPMICSFESRWDKELLFIQSVELSTEPPPGEWIENQSKRVASVLFQPAAYPGIGFEPPFSNWNEYECFCFDVFSPLAKAVDIHVRIDDIHHKFEYSDRFTGTFRITAGSNAICIPVAQVRAAPRGRQSDVANISLILVFAVNPAEEFTLFFDDFRLEKECPRRVGQDVL